MQPAASTALMRSPSRPLRRFRAFGGRPGDAGFTGSTAARRRISTADGFSCDPADLATDPDLEPIHWFKFNQWPGPPGHQSHPPRDAPPRAGTRDRSSQGRPPNAPKPPQGPRWRPHQRRARRRRLQLQPAPAVVQALIAYCVPCCGSLLTPSPRPLRLKSRSEHSRPMMKSCWHRRYTAKLRSFTRTLESAYRCVAGRPLA